MMAKGIASSRYRIAVVFAVLMPDCLVQAVHGRHSLRLPQTNAGSVSDIAVSGNTVYVGGTFTTFGGQSRVNLAAFDLSKEALLPWNPSTDLVGSVSALAVYGSDVFISVAGQGRNRIAQGRMPLPAAWTVGTGRERVCQCVGAIAHVFRYRRGSLSQGRRLMPPQATWTVVRFR